MICYQGIYNYEEWIKNEVAKLFQNIFATQIISFCYVTTEAVFLVMLGTSSFPARHEVYRKTTEKFVPNWEWARIQHD